MTEISIVSASVKHAVKPVLLQLSSYLKIETTGGAVFSPKAKKARGLLALVAMSEMKVVSRHRIAAILWSNLERNTGLARLRDVLHDLRKELAAIQADFLDATGETILFKPNAVAVVNLPAKSSEPDSWGMFLTDLEGIDPAFDRWLIHVRASHRRSQRDYRLADRLEQAPSVLNYRDTRPSIVVTELDITGTSTDIQFSRSLTDELGACLARLRWFATMTRGIQGQRLSIGSEDLSNIADYALVGSLQSTMAGCRLLIKLIDLRNFGSIEWTSIFEQSGPFNQVIQQNIANSVTAQLEAELLFIEAKRQRLQPLGGQENAYTLVMQAIPAIHRLDRDPFIDAGHLLEQAMLLDRESALAHSWMAYWYVFFVGQGWATNPLQSMAQAERVANRAMMLDPKDARAITISGHIKAFLSRQLGQAAAMHELALQLNPALVLAWHFSGMTHAYAGRLDDALHCISRCRELAPNNPQAFYQEGALGIVHLLRHDNQEAIAVGRRVTERHPNFTSAFKSYLSALGHLGYKTEAANALQRLLALEPRFSLRRFHATAPYCRREDLEYFISGLRLAGVK